MKDLLSSRLFRSVLVALGAALAVCCSVVLAAAPVDSTLDVILARARSHLKESQERWAVTICHEDYVQEVFGLRRIGADTVDTVRLEKRVLGSEFLFVWVPASEAWMGFRDVTAVDGTPVPEHVGRLVSLLAGADASLIRLRTLADESSRYNIGPANRNLNEPMVALHVLDEALRYRFRFRLSGQDEMGGVTVQRLEYEETGRPTLLRSGAPLRGILWIDPATGRIHRTRLQADDRASHAIATIDVDYALQPVLGVWVPSQMREDYDAVGSRVKGQAIYSAFRRFETSVRIVEEPT